MRSWMIAFCSGIALCGFIPALPSPLQLAFLSLLAMLLHARRRLLLPAGFLAGAVWFLLWAQQLEQRLWPYAETPDEVLVQGHIWSLPQATATGRRFIFLTREHRFRLTFYGDKALAPGQHWRFLVRVRRPHGMANPGAYDYESWLLQQGITGTGYVRDSALNTQLPPATSRPWFTRLRHAVTHWWHSHDHGQWRYGHILRALTIGERGGIGRQEWTLFSTFGLNHLMVISGLHIALVTLLLYRLALAGRWLLPGLLHYVPATKLAALCSLAGAFCYAGLAGFTLPATRALAMAAVALVGLLCSRQVNAGNAYFLAMFLVLLLDPLAPQSAGFWLSFVAVALLLRFGGGKAETWRQGLRLALRVQLLLCLGMLPVMLVFFQQSSLAAPLVNLFAIPFIGLLVVPLALLAVLCLPVLPEASVFLLIMSDQLLILFMSTLELLQALAPFALITLPPLGRAGICVLILLVLLFLLLRRAWLKGLCLLGLAGLLRAEREYITPGTVELLVLDVGQGLALVLMSRHQVLLYDAGPVFSPDFDIGREVILPVLRRHGVRRVDTVVISHGDADHIGGLRSLEAAYPDAVYYGSEQNYFSAQTSAGLCRDQAWEADGMTFRFLHPAVAQDSRNNSSCVLHIAIGDTNILLPGDIEREVELDLLEHHPALRADILLAPHHGSASSSSWPFIKRLEPGHVVFSAGYLNRFGHPTAEVVKRYRTLGVKTYTTARSGAVRFSIDRDSGAVTVAEYRRERPRFWYIFPD